MSYRKTVEKFKTEEEWKLAIQERNLVPKFWTRWYSSHTSLGMLVILWSLALFPFTIALMIGLIIFLYRAWKYDRFSLKKQTNAMLNWNFIISHLRFLVG